MNAVRDRVNGAGLSDDGPRKPVDDVENWEILPPSKDNQDLLHDFIPLFSRVISDRIPTFKTFEDVIVRHIPHKYSHVMEQKSEQVSVYKILYIFSCKKWKTSCTPRYHDAVEGEFKSLCEL